MVSMIEITDWNQLIAILVAVVTFLWGWWQQQQKKDVIAFYDPQKGVSGDPIITQLPARSWRMSDSTLQWIKFGESDADQKSIEAQVLQHESNQEIEYQIVYSRGGYSISYGLIRSSWRS